MLSRSAERLYWLARYLERTENTAHLISVTMNLIYDLPYGTEIGWHNLITICGVNKRFQQTYSQANEENIVRFLLVDENNPSSLLSSLAFARENIRTCRELMPDVAWEQVNEMYLYCRAHSKQLSTRRERVVFLQDIMRGCQRFTGFISGTMSRNDSYRFISLGKHIERADMTSRMMDFGALLLAENLSERLREHESLVWINVLKALGALLMYRKHVRQRIKGSDVLAFLLTNTDFPRSITYCLNEINDCVIHLPNGEFLKFNIINLANSIQLINCNETSPVQWHNLLDKLQTDFNDLHLGIANTWFYNHQFSYIQQQM